MAAGVLLFKQLDASTFRYNIDLKDTGTTAVGTLWYAWVPGEDFLGASPVNVTSPTGWTATVTHENAGDGFGIQWVNTAAPLQPGATLAGFGFDIQAAPAALSGNSPVFPATPIGTTFIYAGAPLSDAGAQFTIVPTTQPWHNPFSAFDVDNNGRINATDALLVVNHLLVHGPHALGTPTANDNVPPLIDVNGNNSVNATDALFVISDLLLHGSHDATPLAVPQAGAMAMPLVVDLPEPGSATLAILAAVLAVFVRSVSRRQRAPLA